jgi:Fur family ferric uptake transcriptional regulator
MAGTAASSKVGAGGELEIIEPLCAVFRRKLKSEGLKYTPERAQVLDTVMRQDGVFEADTILKLLKGGKVRVSKATVYRTIRLLQEAGILQRVLFDDDPEQSHFQLVYGQRPHDLLIRVDTREAVTIQVPELIELRDRLCAKLGLSPVGHRLQIFAKAKS